MLHHPRRRVGRLGFFMARELVMRRSRFGIARRTRPSVGRTLHALAALATALGLGVGTARAGEGLHLTWNECANGSGVSGRTGACTVNTGEQRLYVAFTLSSPVDQVLGTEVVVDLQAAASTLPDWWHFEPADPGLGLPAGCRYGALSASSDFTGETACTDPWLNLGSAFIAGYAPGEPRSNNAQARIKATTVVPSTLPVSLDASHMYYDVKLIVSNMNTVNPVTCLGCLTKVCLVLNAIWLKRATGAAGGDLLLEGVDGVGSNWASWQSLVSTDCLAVPVRRSTWGQVKSLYR
jgi:hypothetical protein